MNSPTFRQQGQQGSKAQQSAYESSPPPPPPQDDATNNGALQAKHRRGYQACEGCRSRKVRCVMGDVDHPRNGSCDGCTRERRECVFAAQRKKERQSSQDSGTPTGVKRKQSDFAEEDNFDGFLAQPRSVPAVRSSLLNVGSDKLFTSGSQLLDLQSGSLSGASSRPLSATARGPGTGTFTSGINTGDSSPLLHRVQKGGGGGGSKDDHFHSSVAAKVLDTPVASSQETMSLLLKAAEDVSGQGSISVTSPASSSRRTRGYSGVNKDGQAYDAVVDDTKRMQEYEQAIEVWSRMRFVKAGWFTAEEAIDYIEYFYEFLAPMTPVKIPEFASYTKHYLLLTEEPVLALAILTIASRQMELRGQAAVSRYYSIHGELWKALSGMVQRLLWGQEQFGGGICGAGQTPLRESITGQLTWSGSLRTLGTIEALLLLTDWQPRALHFPPGGDENHLVDKIDMKVLNRTGTRDDDAHNAAQLHYANAALEPGWRSDRMSWMLLGLAQSLAFELGVFDSNHDGCGMKHGMGSDCLRKRRLRRLVLLYVTQTSGRLGIKSMLPPEQEADGIFDSDPNRYTDHIDAMQKCWLDLATIMFYANRDVFSSKKRTIDLIVTDGYREQIDKLTPLLNVWKKNYDDVSKKIDVTMRHVLCMEYEYARMFINSLGFNKVVESWKTEGPQVEKFRLAQIAEENKKYTDEVRDGSTKILIHALEGFANKKQLANAAVRTYLRSFAGIMFTLKLFSLGNHETMIKKYVRLLNDMVKAMETQVVDDVHISSTIAAQLKTVIQGVKRTLIRIHKSGNGSGSGSQSRQLSPARVTAFQNQSHPQLPGQRFTNQDSPAFDPLADIQARPLADFSEQTFIPPPNFDPDNDGLMSFDPNIDPSMADLDFANTDWFTLPLDNVLADNSGPVEPGMSGIGPLVGNRDMLDWITETQHANTTGHHNTGWNGNGGHTGHGGTHHNFGLNGY